MVTDDNGYELCSLAKLRYARGPWCWRETVRAQRSRACPGRSYRGIAVAPRQGPTLFRRPGGEKVAPAGQFEAGVEACNLPSMTDGLSTLYQDLLDGSYDCVDRIVLNAYFRMGHSPGGFRVWWRALTGSDETLENAYLMRLAGRFSRRVRVYAKAHNIAVIDCSVGERKHDIATEYRSKTTVVQGLFLVLVGRAPAPVWDVSAKHHIERKTPIPYVNHYSFHILDREWGHLTIKISGHPPFPAQIILNGHEYVERQATKVGTSFRKEGNCFTYISDPGAFAAVTETLTAESAIGSLTAV